MMKTEIFPSLNKYLQHIRCNDTELCRVIREIDSMMSFIIESARKLHPL